MHKYSEEINAKVYDLASYGVPLRMIAKHVGLAPDTMKKYYGDAIETAKIEKIKNVAGALYDKAMEGNTACMMFFLKTQAEWRETDRKDSEESDTIDQVNKIQVEVIGPAGAPKTIMGPQNDKE
jgi:hypothetical protein